MQAFTHFAFGSLVGVLVHRAAPPEEAPARRHARAGAAALVAALSHVLFDDVARMTYHPPDARWGDWFWVIYHVAAVAGAAWVAWRFRRHWPAIAASVLPDLDWILGRPFGLWTEGATHTLFRDLPGLSAVSEALRERVPDLRLHRLAGLGELLLVAGMVLLALRLERPRVEQLGEAADDSSPPPGAGD